MANTQDLRTFQRQASPKALEAARSTPEDEQFVSSEATDLLAERERRIWGEECLESERRFGCRAARLYPLIRRDGRNENAVMTPKGVGTLIDAKSFGCRVQLLRGKTVRFAKGPKGQKEVKPTENFRVEDITPAKRPA